MQDIWVSVISSIAWTWRMIRKNIKEHSASIVIILTTVLLIFYYYYYAVEVQEHSYQYKVHLHDVFEQSVSMKNLTTNDASLRKALGGKCEELYDIARDMLGGERIKLPFQTSQTRWKFHERSNFNLIKKLSLFWNSSSTLRSLKRYRKVKSWDVKVKKYFITFANNCCSKSKIKAIKSARYPGGFDFTTIHDMDSLSERFRHTHAHILRQKRGSGFWLWKPYILLKTLIENMADGDLLMYQDAGAYFIDNAGPLLKLCQNRRIGIIVFHTDFYENRLSKRDAFVLMDMDDIRVFRTFQRLASFVVVRRNCQSLQFVMEWLAYASERRILTDIDNQMGKENLPEFVDNRHDQTVLSLLSKRWGLAEFPDPSQYGNVDGKSEHAIGPYKQLINHSRDTSSYTKISTNLKFQRQ